MVGGHRRTVRRPQLRLESPRQMNLFAIRKHVDRLLHPVVSSLAKLPLHANAWTMSGALVGLVGGVVFYYGEWWLGFVLLLARGLIDHIDGFKARNFNQRSTFGAVMDDVCDRWVLGIMYAGGCLNLSYDYPHVLKIGRAHVCTPVTWPPRM